MNREEISAKSRSEKGDEGREYIYSYGRKTGITGMMAIFVTLAVYYQYTGQRERIYPLPCLIFLFLSFT